MNDIFFQAKLRNAIYEQLSHYGYPEMPKNFHTKASMTAIELAREARHRLISQSEAFAEARRFAESEYQNIYSAND